MIVLKEFNSQDFSRLISWIDSPKFLLQFAGTRFSFPLTHQQLEKHIASENQHVFKAILMPENQVIGHAEIQIYDSYKGLVCRVLIGERKFRGIGLGKKVMQAICRKGFEDLHLMQLDLNVYDWNTPAIKCYTALGFHVIPFQKRQVPFDGEIWTSIRMRRLAQASSNQ